MKPLALAGFACLGAVLTAGCGSDDGGNDRPDTTPPRLLSTDPPDDVVGVALDQVITATFTEPIDIASIDSTRFTLTAGGVPAPGTVSASGRTVRLRPAAQLLPGTEHRAFISGLVTDRAGNPLGADFAWTFETQRDEWRAMSVAAAPEGRTRHTAVWTDSEMIIWGGVTATERKGDGARYRPNGDQWVPMAASPLLGRQDHTAVWSGDQMLVWGGRGDTQYFQSGASYRPSDDRWSPLATAGAPEARAEHTAVWTGTEMIVWGGRNDLQYLRSGARFRPATGA